MTDVDEKTVPCETCGTPTPMTGTKRCDTCFEVEQRLAGYLRRGGAKAMAFVRSALAREDLASVLRPIRAEHDTHAQPVDGCPFCDGSIT